MNAVRLGRREATVIALCASAGAGCQAHGTAGARFNAATEGNAEANASASGEIHADANADEAAHFRIRFVAGKLVQGRENADPRVFFAVNKSDLVGDETFKTLALVRDYLRSHPEMKVSVEGHTDARATDEYNLLLSRQRAGSVKGWLVNNGIEPDRISTVGYGESRLKNRDDPDAAENRRVEFIVKQGAPAKDDPVEPAAQATEGAAARRSAPEGAPDSAPAWQPPATGQALADDCGDPRLGFNVSLGGPRSYVYGAFAWEPACWFQLSAGPGYERTTGDASSGTETASAGIDTITLPVRARFWLMKRHSLIIDVGTGLLRYDVNAEQNDALGDFKYRRTATLGMAFVGAGYGFRSDGPFRFGVLLGVLKPIGSMDASDVTTSFGYPAFNRDQLAGQLDSITNDLTDVGGWGELSFAWLF